MGRIAWTTACVLAVLAAPAGAAISLDWTAEDLGDGLTGYTYYIDNDDGLQLSYAATVAFYTYEGAIINTVFGIPPNPINDEDTADYVAGYGFDKTRDCYSLNPFNYALPGVSALFGDEFTGYRQGDHYFEFSVGTGSGSQYGDNTPLAYIVADGLVDWVGTIARNGVLNEVYTFGYNTFGLDEGGPYVIDPGQTLSLDASASQGLEWDPPINCFQWFTTYADAPGTGTVLLAESAMPSAEVDYESLLALGLQPGQQYDLWMKAGYEGGLMSNSMILSSLTITPEPATLALLVLGATGLMRRRVVPWVAVTWP